MGVLAATTLTGCPDTEGSMDDFVTRSEPFRPGGSRFPDAAPPAGFFDASGHYIMALAAGVDPSKPLAFAATVEVDASDDQNPTIKISLQALTADEARTPVGDTLTTDPVALNRDDGTFEIDYGRVLIDGAADPIIPGAAIEADLILRGQTNSDMEVCGSIAGNIIQPAMLALDGTFGASQTPEGMYAGLTLPVKCTE
ncbi:MAG: hypothetical protein KC549_03560 [Myxococcales bacterium]|nr:hypothetical protein [Myxococcales bacterium]